LNESFLGVEAQTQTVWRQSTKYAIPRIVFINKMDKPAADFEMCLQTIEKKLSTVPVALQMPLGKGKDFIGVIDLINMSKMTWDNKESEASRGKLYKLSALNKSDHYFKRAQEKRVELIETLAMVNNRYFYFDLKSFVSRLIDILT
jgi:elongation factor G